MKVIEFALGGPELRAAQFCFFLQIKGNAKARETNP